MLAGALFLGSIPRLGAQAPNHLPLSLAERWRQFSVTGEAVDLSHDMTHGNPKSRRRGTEAPKDEDLRQELKRLTVRPGTGAAANVNQLGRSAFASGDYSSAGYCFWWALNTLRRAYGTVDHPDIATAITNLALFKFDRHDYDEAGPLFRDACDMRQRLAGGNDDFELARAIIDLGMFHYECGDSMQARPLLDRGLAMYTALCAADARREFAEVLYIVGLARYRSGQYRVADSLFTRSIDMSHRLGTDRDIPAFARMLDAIAATHYERRQYEKALMLFAESCEMRQRWYGGTDHPDLSLSLSNMGIVYDHMGKYSAADSCLSAALAMTRRLTRHSADSTLALRISTLGNFSMRYGDFDQAEPLVRESLWMHRRLYRKDHVDLARSICSRARYYMLVGDYGQARILFEEALNMYRRMYPKIERSELAAVYSGLAHARLGLGMYEGTAVMFSESVQMYRHMVRGRIDASLAESLADYGNFYCDRGDHAKAGPLLQMAFEMFRQLFPDADDPGFARCLTSLAVYHRLRGDYAQAENYLEESLAMRRRLYRRSNHPMIAQTLCAMSDLRAEQGDIDSAKILLEEAVMILRALPHNGRTFDLARALNVMGRLYLDAGDDAAAREYILEAHGMLRRLCEGKDHPDLADNLCYQAMLSCREGRYGRADRLFEEAQKMCRRVFNKYDQLDLMLRLEMMAECAERCNMSQCAGRLYAEILMVLPRVSRESGFFEGEQQQLRFQNRLATVTYPLLDFFRRHKKTEELFNTILSSKGAVLHAVELRNNALRKLGKGDRAISEAERELREHSRRLTDTRSGAEGDEFERWQAAYMKLLGSIERLDEQLTRASTRERRRLRPVTWKGVRRELKPGECVVEFVRVAEYHDAGPDDSAMYCALVLQYRGEPYLVPLCTEAAIRNVLRYQVDARERTSYVHDAARGNELYQLVWGPIDSLLHRARRIYVSPDGLLNRIAIGVLTDSSGAMLLDRYDIRLVLSARDLVRDRAVGRDARGSRRTAVVMGGPGFDADSVTLAREVARLHSLRSSDDLIAEMPGKEAPPRESTVGRPLGNLEGARNEADDVARMLVGNGFAVTPYFGASATEEAFIGLSAPDVLHIATHGFFFSDPGLSSRETERAIFDGGIRRVQYSGNPLLRSGLLFAGADRVWTLQSPAQGIGDGVVTAYDIAHMNLAGTELVVLSACETGLGEIRVGEGVFGLLRAVRAAGAGAVMMSLWKVPDAQTRELMKEFYSNWLEKGMDRGNALAAAQRTMRNQYPDIYSWGAFVLVGD